MKEIILLKYLDPNLCFKSLLENHSKNLWFHFSYCSEKTIFKVFKMLFSPSRNHSWFFLFPTAPERALQQALGWRFSEELFPAPSWICTHFKPSPGRNSSAVMKLLGSWHENIQRNNLPACLIRQHWELCTLHIQSLQKVLCTWACWGWDLGSLQESSCAAASRGFSAQPWPDYWFLQWLQSVIMRKQERNHPSWHKPTTRYCLGLTADLISTDPVVWVGWSFCAWVRVHFVPNSNLSVITVFIIFKAV